MLVDVTLKCPKETIEIYKGLDAIVQKIKEAKALGLDTAASSVHVAGGALTPMLEALKDIGQVEAEFNEHTPEFVQAQGVGSGMLGKSVVELVKEFKKAPPEAPVVSA